MRPAPSGARTAGSSLAPELRAGGGADRGSVARAEAARGGGAGASRAGVGLGDLARRLLALAVAVGEIEAAQAQPLAGQHGLHLGGALLEHRGQAAADADLGA